MKFNKHILLVVTKGALVSFVAAFLMSISTSYAGTPLSTDLTPQQRVKLARLAAKNRQNTDLDSYVELSDKRDDAFDENNAECGNVEIGNIQNNRIGSKPQDVEILIVGDIINVPDGC